MKMVAGAPPAPKSRRDVRGCLEGVTTVQSYAKLMHLETVPRVDRQRADVLKPSAIPLGSQNFRARFALERDRASGQGEQCCVAMRETV